MEGSRGWLVALLWAVLALTACGSTVPPSAAPAGAPGTAPATGPTTATTIPSAPPATDGASDLASAVEGALASRRDPASTAWAAQVPAGTRQVIRTISTDRWCTKPQCTLTQAWTRRDTGWALEREFRSSIGPKGWGKKQRDDGRTPEGVFRIKVTFSTTPTNPGHMPWRRRLPTSNVTDEAGPDYNTWLEEPDRTNGDRPAMRWGLVVDFNNVRLSPGVGPAPVQDAGSGIFMHTSRGPGRRWAASEGCTQVGNPADMRWLLVWLRPDADPRIVQNL